MNIPGSEWWWVRRAMQAAGDMFLGWTTGTGKLKIQFYVRQLSDAKIKPVIEIMKPTNLKKLRRLVRQGAGTRACPLG